MTKTAMAITGLALTLTSAAPLLAQQKIAVVQMQSAIVGTKEGQKAAAELEAKMDPRRKELESKQGELRKLQESLQKSGPAMNDQARAQLAREIDTKNKDYQRSLEDAKGELQGEQDRLLNDLGAKVVAVLNKYAKDHGYWLVMDVSNPQTPIMYASESIDITKEVIELYDKNAPVGGTPAAKPAGSAPVPPPPAKKATPPAK